MPMPDSMMLTPFVLHRPFSDAAALPGSYAGRLDPTFVSGRSPESDSLRWTHTLDVSESVDVRHGCTRTAGQNKLTYADGDEVRITSGESAGRYEVVWVETHNEGTRNAFKRVYLMRHSA